MTDGDLARLTLPELLDLLQEVADEIEIRAMQYAKEGCPEWRPFCIKGEDHEHL